MAPLSDLFRSFLPLHNPIGFGARDFIELEVAVVVALLILARAALSPHVQRFAARTGWCMLALAILPVALRLAMLAQSPVPTPSGADDFAHLLVADTLRHFRLANPSHPLHPFFETIFVLQQPAYSSIFPIGQGLALALGRAFFGHPWAGVVLSIAALCALCYWMLRAWTTPTWALAGGLLAVIEFGPLRYWMNTYWGGAVSAVAGCLIFGALPRLREYGHKRHAALLGLGLALQLLCRPFEFGLVLLAVFLFGAWRPLFRAAPVIALAFLPAVGLTLLHNHQVTGSWTTLPYSLSQYQYGVPAAFTFQPNPVPHVPLTAAQQLDYDAQVAVHGKGTDTFMDYWSRFIARARFYRFFFLPPLYLALPFFLPSLRQYRFLWVGIVLLLLSLGTNFYPYFYPHYIAVATCLFVLISVTALERLSRLSCTASLIVLLLCAAHFLFWYGFHVFANSNVSIAMLPHETWDFVNHADPDGRIAINNRLAQAAGKQLVFVRYWPQHRFEEWVQNAADIDQARVVWALDLGAEENAKLLRYYPDRQAWLLEPDAHPPRLTPNAAGPPQ